LAFAVAFGIGAAIWSIPARAQNFPNIGHDVSDPDDLFMRDSEEGHLAEVFYSNSATSSSTGFDGVMEHNGVQVHVSVRIGGDDVQFAEILEVRPLHPQHVVFPEGPVNVLDGEEIVVQIMTPLF
jgi:hypothetical protein